MNATFTPPQHSKSSRCLASTPPFRQGSTRGNERISRVSSAPSKILAFNNEPEPVNLQNAVFVNAFKGPKRGSIQREKRMSPLTSLKGVSSMMLDHTARQRSAAAKSIGLTRANISCDRIPSMPVRMQSPVKTRRQTDIIFSSRNDSMGFEQSDHLTHAESQSSAICKPGIKSNMFLQSMKASTIMSTSSKQAKNSRNRISKSNSERRSYPTDHIQTLRLSRSPSIILDAAQLGASELSDKDHLISRWDSSSSLSKPIRLHESISSSQEFFLNRDEARMSRRSRSLIIDHC